MALVWPELHYLRVNTLPPSHILLVSLFNAVSHLNKSILYIIEATKLMKLGIFFIKAIIDSKLTNKLPNYMFVFLSLHHQAKSPTKVHELLFHTYKTLFSPKILKIAS